MAVLQALEREARAAPPPLFVATPPRSQPEEALSATNARVLSRGHLPLPARLYTPVNLVLRARSHDCKDLFRRPWIDCSALVAFAERSSTPLCNASRLFSLLVRPPCRAQLSPILVSPVRPFAPHPLLLPTPICYPIPNLVQARHLLRGADIRGVLASRSFARFPSTVRYSHRKVQRRPEDPSRLLRKYILDGWLLITQHLDQLRVAAFVFLRRSDKSCKLGITGTGASRVLLHLTTGLVARAAQASGTSRPPWARC
eukprot:4602008-Pleurochrysis_carterae.AAC.1